MIKEIVYFVFVFVMLFLLSFVVIFGAIFVHLVHCFSFLGVVVLIFPFQYKSRNCNAHFAKVENFRRKAKMLVLLIG